MTWPSVLVGACAVAIVVWVLLYAGCASALPAEPPYVVTVALQRDH